MKMVVVRVVVCAQAHVSVCVEVNGTFVCPCSFRGFLRFSETCQILK